MVMNKTLKQTRAGTTSLNKRGAPRRKEDESMYLKAALSARAADTGERIPMAEVHRKIR
jgi:hypothetical protein